MVSEYGTDKFTCKCNSIEMLTYFVYEFYTFYSNSNAQDKTCFAPVSLQGKNNSTCFQLGYC